MFRVCSWAAPPASPRHPGEGRQLRRSCRRVGSCSCVGPGAPRPVQALSLMGAGHWRNQPDGLCLSLATLAAALGRGPLCPEGGRWQPGGGQAMSWTEGGPTAASEWARPAHSADRGSAQAPAASTAGGRGADVCPQGCVAWLTGADKGKGSQPASSAAHPVYVFEPLTWQCSVILPAQCSGLPPSVVWGKAWTPLLWASP